MVNKSKSKGSNKTGGGGKGQKTQKVKKKSQQKGQVKEDTTTTIEIIEPKNVLTEVQQNGEINGNSIQVSYFFSSWWFSGRLFLNSFRSGTIQRIRKIPFWLSDKTSFPDLETSVDLDLINIFLGGEENSWRKSTTRAS